MAHAPSRLARRKRDAPGGASRDRMKLLALLAALLALPLVAPAVAADPPTYAPNAAYVDARGAHAATFAYDGPCDGLGTVTVRLLDTYQTLTAQVWSKSVGTCGAGLSCLDCPPVPTAYAWELTGLGVALVGGGPSVYDHYADQPLAYALAGQCLDGALVAFGTI